MQGLVGIRHVNRLVVHRRGCDIVTAGFTALAAVARDDRTEFAVDAILYGPAQARALNPRHVVFAGRDAPPRLRRLLP